MKRLSELDNIDPSDQTEYITFVAGKQSFCIHIKKIREIRRWTPVTALPFSATHVLGVINLRGAVIPIIDLAAKLQFAKITPSERHVIIIVDLDQRTIGLLVDSVSEILSISNDMRKEAPKSNEDTLSQAIEGIIPRETNMIKIINISKLLNTEHENSVLQ